MQIKYILNKIIKSACSSAGIEIDDVKVVDATRPEFGDYQFNGAMGLAKRLKKSPREIAKNIVKNIPDSEILGKVEIAGAGFINITISESWINKNVELIAVDNRLKVSLKKDKDRVVIDYSSPNMAKQMHVGHLRSTIIGDTIANLLVFLGDEVIRQNHIGDWGTQFGMLIAYLEEFNKVEKRDLSDLEEFYKEAKKRFDEDENFVKKSRDYVVKLQGGDEKCLKLWKEFIDISLTHCEEVYSKLNIKLKREDVKAESSYNDYLKLIIKDLEKKSILVESQGAKCVFIDGEENPFIVQKSDGGYLYATTDLAAIKFRVQELKANRISYVVDARQSEHFRQLFKVARMVGYVDEKTQLEHIAFGLILDKSGKPFKTRDGGTVKLIELLNEAVSRAKDKISRRDEYSDKELQEISEIIGIGAVKYADLSINRESNYIFDWDKMLSLDGNTSLYQQYAYARIQSILRKSSNDRALICRVQDELERKIALKLLQFEETLLISAKEAKPHFITTYLYELTTLFMKFYESKPILKQEVNKELRDSRLLLAETTAKTIKKALEILGIKVLDRV